VTLPRLLQLASPTLPIGAYTYSQGLEWAIEAGSVRDEASAAAWIGGLLHHAVGAFEAPLVAAQQAALAAAWSAADGAADCVAHCGEAARLNSLFIASRESAELRAETLQMGYSFRRLLHELPEFAGSRCLAALDAFDELAFPTAWSAVAAHWQIDPADALTAYLWSWCENQTMAALKAVPLGQSAGQRLLLALGGELEAVAGRALTLPEADWSNFAPAFAIACSRHETQYSRLFRS
jgi:urease accessory protein